MIILDKFETTHIYVYVYNIKIMLYYIIYKYVYVGDERKAEPFL